MSDGDFTGLITLLAEARVEFVMVGGLAAIVRGSAHVTYDLDIVYRRTPDNIDRLANALRPVAPYMRGAPAGLPFTFNAATIQRGLNFTLSTTLGDLDVLGEIAGGGTYDSLVPDSTSERTGDVTFRCVTLRRLIALKRAAGRPKDLDVLAGLEALLEETDRT